MFNTLVPQYTFNIQGNTNTIIIKLIHGLNLTYTLLIIIYTKLCMALVSHKDIVFNMSDQLVSCIYHSPVVDIIINYKLCI